MKRIYKDLFHIPKFGKIREKVILARGITALFTVLLCLAAISFTAYAYFATEISFGKNVIQAASFDLDIRIVDENGNEPSVTGNRNSGYRATLEPGVVYEVTLKPAGTADTGFCVVTAADRKMHTQQLGVDHTANDKITEKITFTVQLGAGGQIKMQPHWGTSVHYDEYRETRIGSANYITHSDEITVGEVMPATDPDTEETTPDETLPEETTPATTPAETTPEQTPPDETTPATQPEETTPVTQPEETQPEDTTPADQPTEPEQTIPDEQLQTD